jgi:hypothetical protein
MLDYYGNLKCPLKKFIINQLHKELIDLYQYKDEEFIKHIIECYINDNYEDYKKYSYTMFYVEIYKIIKEELCKLIIMNEGEY